MPASPREHTYGTTVTWTGNTGSGTTSHRSYERLYDISSEGKPVIAGSSDPAFRGDPARYNPEDLLVASLSACHMLWYLSLSAKAGIVVTAYRDRAEGTMAEAANGSGRFTHLVLRPEVTVAAGTDLDKADAIHHDAHAMCFIANSINFPITVEATYTVAAD
ncbi:MAG TPA: OsmC family protein [Thermomicrobiales bacterium]|nr:OsmC family protein [Thermomicrobiales bacterium]